MIYLKAQREEKNITQVKLAKASGLSQATVSKIEQGLANPTVTTLNKLAKSMNIPLLGLLTDTRKEIKLSRHEIDSIAKNIIDGVIPINKTHARIVKDISLLISQKLSAFNKPGRHLARNSRWNTKSRYTDIKEKYSDKLVEHILKRIDKLI